MNLFRFYGTVLIPLNKLLTIPSKGHAAIRFLYRTATTQRHNKVIIPITPLLVLFLISMLIQVQQATINQSCSIIDWGLLYRFRAYMPPLKPRPHRSTLFQTSRPLPYHSGKHSSRSCCPNLDIVRRASENRLSRYQQLHRPYSNRWVPKASSTPLHR